MDAPPRGRQPSTMHANRTTAAALAVLTLALAGVAGAVTAGASPATQAENATVDHHGDRLALVTGANVTVTGTTTLDAGTEVTVRIRSTGESPFLQSRGTTVTEGGTFAATFDLSDRNDGTNATVTVGGPNGTLAEVDARLVAEPTPTPTATPTATPTVTATPTDSGGTTPGGGSSGDGPGFGAAVAVLALAAAGLLAGRRG